MVKIVVVSETGLQVTASLAFFVHRNLRSCSSLQLKQPHAHPVLRSFACQIKGEIAIGKNGRVFLRSCSREETLLMAKTVLLDSDLNLYKLRPA